MIIAKITKRRFFTLVAIVVVISMIVWLTSDFSHNPETIFLRYVVGFIAVWAIYRGSKEEFIANPYYLFSLTPITLLIYTEKVSNYYLKELTPATWILAIINFFAFLIALSSTKPYRKDTTSKETSNGSQMVTHTLVMLAIGAVPRTYNFFLHRPMFLASVLVYFGYLSLCTAIKSKKRWLISLVIVYYILGFFISFTKTMLIAISCTVIVSLEKFIVTEKKQKAKVIGLTVVLAFIMVAIGFPLKAYMAGGGDFLGFFQGIEVVNQEFTGYGNRIDLGRLNAIQMPYMYLVSAWNNVQYVMQTQPSQTYGLWFIKPLLGYLQMDGFFSEAYALVPYSSFNTFTFVTVFFKDFGLIGSAGESLFLGWFVKKIYTRCLNSSSPFWTACYAMTACAVTEMFFSNHFFMLSYPFTIIIISYLYRLVFKKARTL